MVVYACANMQVFGSDAYRTKKLYCAEEYAQLNNSQFDLYTQFFLE